MQAATGGGGSEVHFFDLEAEQLADHCAAIGVPGYTHRQLLSWVYRRGVVDPAAMTDLSHSTRQAVAQSIRFIQGTTIAHQQASDGTQKLLVDWSSERRPAPDEATTHSLPVTGGAAGAATECVMIPADQRRTACISSQVGCPVGCRFCASGIGGLGRNLTAGQIVEQVHHLNGLPDVGRVSNVVFMGIGEPLANFANVIRAITILNAAWGMGIGARRITVSTVGLPASIRKLAAFALPVTLALSLHAPNDEIRRRLIPWAEYASIEELLDACEEYFARTGREITLEYILIRNVNDRVEHARELASTAKRLRSNINLIRYNEVKGLEFERPATDDVLTFQRILREQGINTHIRASRGRDIAAACGQLRREATEESGTAGGRQT